MTQLELSMPDAPRSTVLLLSDAAQRAYADALTASLTKDGALVTRVDADALRRLLDQTTSGCVFPSGDLDNLARFVQAYTKLPGYQPAILLGLGVGAGLVAGALEQAPESTFAGAIVLDYCGQPGSSAPFCPRAQPVSDAPPLVRLARERAACPPGTPAQFAEPALEAARLPDEFAKLAARAQARAVAAPTAFGDLPVIEVAASGGSSDTFGVFLSGDGGWAGFDEKLSERLAERGIPIVGFDSLRYFWRARTPDGTAADIAHIIEHYRSTWKRDKVRLIGFSQGADVLPFIMNRFTPATRASITSAVALSISSKASFEFHLSNWLGPSGDAPTLPEMQRLGHDPVVYVCGQSDADAICPQLDPANFKLVSLPGDHHFDDAYDKLVEIILGTPTVQ
ncbi:MAG: AcvB/VirJ family lysyl-phosphatidylglycerol hydrolase [Polyangiaceae bacterium]